jgi:HAMP domain-containing protein
VAGSWAPSARPANGAQRLTQNQVIAWRRRALDQQLPAAAFPAGSNAPSLVYLWATMFVAVVAVLGFAIHGERGVPPAVLDSQRDIMGQLATGINTNTNLTFDLLEETVASARGPSPEPDAQLLTKVLGDRTTWTGASIVDATARRTLTAAGTTPPLNLIPAGQPIPPTVAVTMPDGPAIIRSRPLDATRTLLAFQPLTMRNLRLNPDGRHGVFVLTADGKFSLMQGVSAVESSHLPAIFQTLSPTGSRQVRTIAVEEWPDRQLVLASARVGDTGITVASLIIADITGGASVARGFLLGFTLLAVAVPSFLLMRASIVRPLRALLKQAKADACGASIPKQRLRIAEAYRIARALAVSSGRPLPRKRSRPPAMVGLTAATVLALLWPAVAVATISRTHPSIPTQLVRDQESRAEATSSSLGNALNGGLQIVARISQGGTSNRTQLAATFRREMAETKRFRGLYLVDPTGKVVASNGRRSLRTVEPVPGEYGIQLDESIKRLPLIYAYYLGRDGFAVVGEFDIDYLVRMMRQVDGRARVVDSQLRAVLDSEGYQAFHHLQGAAAQDVAVESLPGRTIGVSKNPDGSPVLIAAASLTTPPSVAHLEWSVIVERDVAVLGLPTIVERRWTLVVAGAVVGIVLLTMAWQFFIFVQPLRRLAAAADEVSRGSFEMPIPPQRHDDLGAIAMCLEICRQVRHTGSARFGGAVRLRGSEENFTTVLPLVRAGRTTRV